LLRKKIYQDAILQPLQALQEKKLIPQRFNLDKIVCPKCFSQTYQKFGVRHNKYGDMQHYVCKACNHRFVINPAFENAKASAKIITAAIDLYFKGISFRKIGSYLLNNNFLSNCFPDCVAKFDSEDVLTFHTPKFVIAAIALPTNVGSFDLIVVSVCL
jgi:transposase-like protein